jgi:cytochrome oxidase assembly protein ShyY1
VKFPLLPSLIVAAAVATMIGLGIWQLGRAAEKEALKARYAQNSRLPEMALQPVAGADDSLLYRRASAFCLEVTGWRLVGGRSASGRPGTRYLAQCRTGAEGPGFVADMGVSSDPRASPAWRGGEVRGIVVNEPRAGGLVQRLRGSAPPPRPMIVSAAAAPGLEPSAPPEPAASNSSWFYAFQWFFFALAAGVVYVLALRRRRRHVAGGARSA